MQTFDLNRLDRTARILAICGVLAFIDTFLEWASVSVGPYSFSWSAWSGPSGSTWSPGFGAWFPMLVLFLFGIVVALPAFNISVIPQALTGIVAAVIGVVLLIILMIRGLTYPSEDGITASASYGLYLGVVITLVVAVVGWLGYQQQGGSFNQLTARIKQAASNTPTDQQPPQG
jgi:hypothetical protein